VMHLEALYENLLLLPLLLLLLFLLIGPVFQCTCFSVDVQLLHQCFGSRLEEVWACLVFHFL